VARLDVTDLLLDDDFIDTFAVIPSTVSVNDYGIAEALRQAVQAIGSVQPATGHDLTQFAEGDTTGGVIKLFTVYPLTTGDAQRGADQVYWADALYTVFNVQSYRNYASGRGHVEALARLASLNPSTLPRPDDAGYLG